MNLFEGAQKNQNLTPVKRKLWEQNNTSSLVCIFETKTKTFGDEENQIESLLTSVCICQLSDQVFLYTLHIKMKYILVKQPLVDEVSVSLSVCQVGAC